MKDRRSTDRRQVDVHLDDLQSEMEAGARALDKINDAVLRLDGLGTHFRQSEILGCLRRQVTDLRASIRLQRLTLSELRMEMRKLRSETKRARESAAAASPHLKP